MAIERVGIVGGGTMGSGIAQSAVTNGFPVVLADVDRAAAERGAAVVGEQLRRAVERGRLEAPAAEAAAGRLEPAGSLDALADCDLVIEAVFEDLDVKKDLFRRIDGMVRADTRLATNTSSFRVDDLAGSVSAPERFLGMHYFVPAGSNKLVEIVRGDATDDAAVDDAVAFAKATGKQPLVCRDSNGFVVNRFFIPFYNEAARVADDGVAPAQIDNAAKTAFGAAAGPFFVMNLSKPRIALHSCRTLDRFGSFYAPAPRLIAQGEADQPFEIAEAEPLAGAARDAVVDRLRAAAFLPALQLLDEQVTTPANIDLGATLALRWDDPPCAVMDRLGRDRVAELLDELTRRFTDIRMPASLARVGALLA